MATTIINSGDDGTVRQNSATSYQAAVNGSGNGGFTTFNQTTHLFNAFIGHLCSRAYIRFDTTGIATDQVATGATIILTLQSQRGATDDNSELHKFFISTDHTSAISAGLYDEIGDGASDEVDVGNTVGSTSTFTLDSTGIAYINTQIAAGDECAFLLRCHADYDDPTTNATGVNFRTFRDFEDSTTSLRPKLTITHDTGAGASGFGHNVLGVASANIGSINGIATANIGKVNTVD